MPRHIAVVTSPTGAVIRDVLHRIADRFPVHVTVWPVRVQGETTGREVANAVHQLNQGPNQPDLIIVARGGGSLEDLWGFNDEVVVRSVCSQHVPVISAVGHETDWTLIDLVADHRAPTPTAAAERAVPVKADLEAAVADLGARVRGAVSRFIVARKTQFRATERGLASPDQLFALPRRAFDEASGRLTPGFGDTDRPFGGPVPAGAATPRFRPCGAHDRQTPRDARPDDCSSQPLAARHRAAKAGHVRHPLRRASACPVGSTGGGRETAIARQGAGRVGQGV